jgi:hypothetical protein
MAANINVEVFHTRKAAESKRREHEHYALSNWADVLTFSVEEHGEGWAVCERGEDGEIVCFY